MQSEIEIITTKNPEFSIEIRKEESELSTELTPVAITFEHDTLYQLFKRYLNETTVHNQTNNENSSLGKYGKCTFIDEAKKVLLGLGYGIDNVVGKFFLETDLNWPQHFYDKKLIASNCKKYKQFLWQPESGQTYDEVYGKGVPIIRLAWTLTATIPDNIMYLMENKNSLNAIKRFAPLFLQAKRNPSFFANLPKDILSFIAHHLEPHNSFAENSAKWNAELSKASIFCQNMQLVTCQPDQIACSDSIGTHVNLSTSERFKVWFDSLPKGRAIPSGEDCCVFKPNDNTLCFNSGEGKPGIKIIREGNVFKACNNLTVEMNDNNSPDAKANNLLSFIAELNSNVKAVTKEVKKLEVVTEKVEPKSNCSIQ